MRLESFRVEGFGPFKKAWTCDLSELRGLVAVTGANGAGKSSFLELALPGALYRQTPTRGSLVDLATARNACLSVTVVNGQRWNVTHLVDSVSGKSEVVVVDDNHQPAIPDSKVKSYDGWAATHWPAPEVLLSTIFGAQGTGGFLAAKPAERKSILLRVLGVERLERLAEQAREKLKAAKAQLDTTAARLHDEAQRGGDVAEIERVLDGARQDLFAAENTSLAAQKQLDSAIEEEQRVKAVEQTNAAIVRSRDAIDDRVAAIRSDAEQMLPDLEVRLVNNRALLDEAEAIRAAVAEIDQVRSASRLDEITFASAKSNAETALAPWRDVNERLRAATSRADRARARLKDAPAIQAAKTELTALRDTAEEGAAEVAKLAAQLEELRATHLAGADERITGLRSAIETMVEIADHEAAYDDISIAGRDGLYADDEAVTAVKTIPLRTSELKERHTAACARQADAARQLANAERLASRGADVDGAAVELTEAERDGAALAEGHAAALRAAEASQHVADSLAAKVTAHAARIAVLEPVAKRAHRIEGAAARVAELEPQIAALRAELATLAENRKAFDQLKPVPPAPDLPACRSELKRWQDEAIQANRTISLREGQLLAAQVSAGRRAEFELLEQQQLAEVADWTRVAADLGKDGLQALEIDAAGPELTAICNDILHRAHGPRFTMRVETQRASADGKRQLEGCDVMVLDTVQGREASGETFSGGERVVLSEALALAITVLACRRSGLTDVSLVRDESGAALDPGNARVYVAMLRHAVELIGARHCLLVSHVPEVQELCDHRIEVGS